MTRSYKQLGLKDCRGSAQRQTAEGFELPDTG